MTLSTMTLTSYACAEPIMVEWFILRPYVLLYALSFMVHFRHHIILYRVNNNYCITEQNYLHLQT